jgi:hypothetical protein
MCGTDEGNPRQIYAGIHVMIPVPRARQPREEEMKCGSQPADIRVHRRKQTIIPHVALLARCPRYHLEIPIRLSAEENSCTRLTE